MEVSEVRNNRKDRFTIYGGLSLAGFIVAAFCMLLFIFVRPVSGWEFFPAPHDDNFDIVLANPGSGLHNFDERTDLFNARQPVHGLVPPPNAVTTVWAMPRPAADLAADYDHKKTRIATLRTRTTARRAGFEIAEDVVLGIVSDIYLNSFQVPVFALDLSRRYFWPASFADRLGQISPPILTGY
jgi:hypothetical protein